ncbi:unnamed protein product, partial [Rotaria sp. Silwood1]
STGALRWNTSATTIVNSSQILGPSGIYINSNNTLFIVDEYPNEVVRRLLSNAVSVTNVAGQYQSGGSSSTQFNYPQDVYVDARGNMYVSDFYNYRIQKFTNGSSNGTTIAGITGSAGSAFSQFNGLRYFTFNITNGVLMAGNNGAGNSNTTLNNPWGIHYLPSVSNDLFITNYNGHSVMRWTPGASSGYFVAGVPGVSGQTSMLLSYPIGTGIAGNTATQLNSPRGIAFDSAMNLYVSDTGNGRIQKFLKL